MATEGWDRGKRFRKKQKAEWAWALSEVVQLFFLIVVEGSAL